MLFRPMYTARKETLQATRTRLAANIFVHQIVVVHWLTYLDIVFTAKTSEKIKTNNKNCDKNNVLFDQNSDSSLPFSPSKQLDSVLNKTKKPCDNVGS